MDVRASDLERDATVERLREAAGEGRLTFEELTDRVEAASTAVMRSDLAALTADLPAPGPLAPIEPARAHTLGDIKRSGTWAVPADNSFRSWFGNVQLDLRQARITDNEIRVNAWTLFGTIDLLVPEGVEVDVRAEPRLGQLKLEAGAPPVPGAPRIVLPGGTVVGTIKVRHTRLWEKWLRRLEGR